MHRLSVILGVVLVAGLAFLGGWATGYYLAPPAARHAAEVRSSTLSMVAAGTLGTVFGSAATAVASYLPGVSAPPSAQLYEGSLLALEAAKAAGASYDVAAAADYRLIPQVLEPSGASWEAVFGTTPEVLAYDPTVSALSGINASNWAAKMTQPGVVLGVANASTDPNGYNGIFVLQLEGLREGGTLSTIYGHFYTGAPGEVANPIAGKARIEPESQAATILGNHTVSAFLIYRSYAVAHRLAYVPLNGSVGLGDRSPGAIAFDAQAATSILAAGGTTTKVTGAPVAFAVTVPSNAANASLGIAFVQYLFSPAGTALLVSNGFDPVSPGWSDHPAAVPPELRPDVTSFPTGLPAA